LIYVEAPLQAGDELAGLVVAMDAAQDVSPRHRNVVLDEVLVDPGLAVEALVVRLDIVSAEILEDRRRLDQPDGVEGRREGLHVNSRCFQYWGRVSSWR